MPVSDLGANAASVAVGGRPKPEFRRTDWEARMGARIHGGAYRLTWSDEFDGVPGTPADSGTWQAETGGSGWGNQELQYQ